MAYFHKNKNTQSTPANQGPLSSPDVPHGIAEFHNIYFACTGNTCRSPMAQRIFMHAADAHGLSMVVGSRKAYVNTFDEDALDDKIIKSAKAKKATPISEGTAQILLGVYHDKKFVNEHVARDFKPDELERSELVLCMSSEHASSLKENLEAYTAEGYVKVYSLGQAAGNPDEAVSDPFGKNIHVKGKDGKPKFIPDMKAYAQTYVQLSKLINKLFDGDLPAFKTVRQDFFERVEKSQDQYLRMQEALAAAKLKKESTATGTSHSLVESSSSAKPSGAGSPNTTYPVMVYSSGSGATDYPVYDDEGFWPMVKPKTPEEILEKLSDYEMNKLEQELSRRELTVDDVLDDAGTLNDVLGYLSKKSSAVSALVTLEGKLSDFTSVYAPAQSEMRTAAYSQFKQMIEKSINDTMDSIDAGLFDTEDRMNVDRKRVAGSFYGSICMAIPYIADALTVMNRNISVPASFAGYEIIEYMKEHADPQLVKLAYNDFKEHNPFPSQKQHAHNALPQPGHTSTMEKPEA